MLNAYYQRDNYQFRKLPEQMEIQLHPKMKKVVIFSEWNSLIHTSMRERSSNPYVKPILEEYYYDTILLWTIHVRINYIARCKDRKEIYRPKLWPLQISLNVTMSWQFSFLR